MEKGYSPEKSQRLSDFKNQFVKLKPLPLFGNFFITNQISVPLSAIPININIVWIAVFFVNYIWEADSPVQLIEKFVMKTCLENQHKKINHNFPRPEFY